VKGVTLLLRNIVLAVIVPLPYTLMGAQRVIPTASNEYVTGVVTSPSSAPVRSVWVILYDGTALRGRSLTGDDGRYYVGRLDKKTYRIIVRRQVTGNDLFKSQVILPQNRNYNIRLP
jgi:hypothetical protein